MKNMLRFGALALTFAIAPLALRAAPIGGQTAGKTAQLNGPDDLDTATTIPVTFQTFCPWIVQGAAAYPAYKFVFAGQGVASSLNPIDPGDFTINTYSPWVVNNNYGANGNSFSGLDNVPFSRGVTNQDAWGTNFVVSYTPLNAGDPTNVNFVQAFIESDNGGAFASGVIDSSGGSPYYNQKGISGVGNQRMVGTIPFQPTATKPAWELDDPYDCENGQAGVSNADCTGGADETLTSQTVYFQTFIEQNWVNPADHKTYQVLYGGVQWGYAATTAETPEPASLILTGAGLLLASFAMRRYRRNGES